MLGTNGWNQYSPTNQQWLRPPTRVLYVLQPPIYRTWRQWHGTQIGRSQWNKSNIGDNLSSIHICPTKTWIRNMKLCETYIMSLHRYWVSLMPLINPASSKKPLANCQKRYWILDLFVGLKKTTSGGPLDFLPTRNCPVSIYAFDLTTTHFFSFLVLVIRVFTLFLLITQHFWWKPHFFREIFKTTVPFSVLSASGLDVNWPFKIILLWSWASTN